MIQRVVGLKQLQFLDSGEIKLMGISGIFLPLVTWGFLIKLFEEKIGKKDSDSILYFVGENQGIQSVRLLSKKFGYKIDSKKIIDPLINQGPLLGLGQLILTRLDEKRKVMIIENPTSPFALNYRQIFGIQKMPVDMYLRGLLGGVARELFNADMVAVERTCVVMGKNKCVIEIKEREKFSTDDDFIKAQLPNVSLRPTEIELSKWFTKK
ncbi:hypothetical protein GOV04_03240 [Candidatus Woesearchaeota archaeon]|nr:hypothetical protein [Candidatus Woesearchaeota archaeon]